ncbi:MAG: cupin domain-containing protein [Candidatus Thermoplasmatota archaeon]|nr:cupin domain-containing protein [Candidatus Thermoplasmatota archaeon]
MGKAVFIKKGCSQTERRMEGRTYRMKLKTDRMEAVIAVLEPGAESKMFRHEGEEFHLILKGPIIYEVDGEEFIMEEGDILWHLSTSPHRAKNPYSHEAKYITVGSPPTFM